MKKQGIVHLIALLLLALLVTVTVPAAVHEDVRAADPAFSVCSVCLGTGICGNCNPYNTLDSHMPAEDKLGDGWIRCGFCDENGMRICGTNHTGDGTPIGCDGTGKVLCDQCGGTGQDGDHSCPKCEGTGKMNCYQCEGTGKYLCDACNGTHRFACRCRLDGHTGLCSQCGGSGWTLIDYDGSVLEYGVVHYPQQGDIIDYGIRRYGTGSYNAAYGTGITPSQYVDKMNGGTGVNGIGYLNINQPTPIIDLTGGAATAQIVANGGTVGGSGQQGSTGDGSHGQQGNTGDGNHGQQGGDPGPGPGPDNNDHQGGDPNPGPEPDPDGNPYTQDIPDDASIVAALGDEQVEMIYLLNREVDGNLLLTVQINKQYLTAEEKAKLETMTEADVRAVKDDLETLANGFRFTETGDPTFFDFGREYRLPVTCDILLELPGDAADDSRRPLHVYRVLENGWEKERNHTIDHFEGKRYLIFTYDTLGRFVLTAQTEDDLRGGDTPLVDWNGEPVQDPNGNDRPGDDPNDPQSDPGTGGPNGGTGDPGNDPQGNPGNNAPNGGNSGPESGPDGGPAPADDSAKKGFPVLPVAAGAVAVAVVIVFAASAKKKNK